MGRKETGCYNFLGNHEKVQYCSKGVVEIGHGLTKMVNEKISCYIC